MIIQVYTCQKCGEEFDSGDLSRNGKHVYCGGQGDPNGQIDTDDDSNSTPTESEPGND